MPRRRSLRPSRQAIEGPAPSAFWSPTLFALSYAIVGALVLMFFTSFVTFSWLEHQLGARDSELVQASRLFLTVAGALLVWFVVLFIGAKRKNPPHRLPGIASRVLTLLVIALATLAPLKFLTEAEGRVASHTLAEGHVQEAEAASRRGDDWGAVLAYRKALAHHPWLANAGRELSWIMATSSDARIRESWEHFSWADHACHFWQPEWPSKDMRGLEVQAAVFARDGHHESGAECLRVVIKLSMAAGVPDERLERLRHCLELYEYGKPFTRQ